jgi:uncharacterized protein (TIGR02611 family)
MAGGPSTEEESSSVTSQRRRTLRSMVEPIRARFHATPGGRLAFRILVALLGLVCVVVGLALVPLPGPGWLIVLGGVAIWAIEFVWARHLLRFARDRLHWWNTWLGRQHWLVRVPLLLALIAIVATALWLSVKHGLGFDPVERIFGANG